MLTVGDVGAVSEIRSGKCLRAGSHQPAHSPSATFTHYPEGSRELWRLLDPNLADGTVVIDRDYAIGSNGDNTFYLCICG